MKHKIAILASHPIQYQAPLFRTMAASPEIEPHVFFIRKIGTSAPMYDPEFGKEIKWDIPLLDGYDHSFLRGTFDLPRLLLKNVEDYEAILLLGWNSPIHWLSIAAARMAGIKIFMRAESPLNQELLKQGALQAVKKLFLRMAFWLFSAFLYIGRENKKFYEFMGVPEEKLFFAPYAVENDRFFTEAKKYLSRKEESRSELRVPSARKLILFAGKLIDKKRPMDLLRAYAEIKSEDKALIFVGDGNLRPELEAFVKGKDLKDVFFAGFKNQTEIGRYYAMADIFVLPSGAGETWGLVVNEAMCFGLPVVVSDVVGCGPDLVAPNENGFVFPLGDIVALTRALSRLVGDPKLCKDFGAASLATIENYSYSEDIAGILEALKKNGK